MDQGETNIAQFEYDGDGNRTAAVFSSETTSFLYDGGHVIAELDGQGGLKAFYVLGADGAVSRLAANRQCYPRGDSMPQPNRLWREGVCMH